MKSSFGHVRDLPKGDMGIDTEHDFLPHYVVPRTARKNLTDLRKTAAKADTIIFATDEDREGEAISWHLLEVFKKEIKEGIEGKTLQRIAFHEITKEAIAEALKNPREIDLHMVNAQQARRILDRLVGYNLSPLLWAKITKGLSAGRVQSVALRFIVEREREIQAFKAEEYWTIEGIFENKEKASFEAKLVKIGEESLEKFSITAEADAKKIIDALVSASFNVNAVTKKISHRSPPAPYTTSTLQQDANRKLGFSAKQTMMLAQQLYEGVVVPDEGQVGLITYMRTDAVNLSEQFLKESRTMIEGSFGASHVPEEPRHYKAKSRLAQEAHEAIRPSSANRHPASIKENLEPNQYKLYDLIWRRAVASQMKDAELETNSADILGAEKYMFRASGTRVTFDGFLALYPDGERPTEIPALAEGEAVTAQEILPKQHFTEPPARYSDASLVKIMEENGIGRPSTYAPTIGTIIERNYVERIEGRRLKPTEIAFVVNDLLVENFPIIVDYQFTAKMEEGLDEIAEGNKEWVPVIREFYEPFKKNLDEKAELLQKTEIATDEKCDLCGKPMVIKMGRFGKFFGCTGYPECKGIKRMGKTGEVLPEEKTDEKCPTCGAPMKVKYGRFGAFLSCSTYPACKTIKPMLKLIGLKCPTCTIGDVAERRTKRGKHFWGCSRYPDCDYTSWTNPLLPPKEGSLTVPESQV